MSIQGACSALQRVVAGELEQWRAPGTKQDFFVAVQSIANLTARAHNAPSAEHRIAPHGKAPRVLVVGDSIARELAQALHAMAQTGGTGASGSGEEQAALPAAGTRGGSLDITYRMSRRVGVETLNSALDVQATPYEAQASSEASKTDMAHARRELEECRLDALFLGGYGPWSLRRFDRHSPSVNMTRSPLLYHDAFISRELRTMACVAKRTHTPVVFLGQMPLDGRTMLLDPPKNDWYAFYDYGLASQLSLTEERAYARLGAISDASGGTDAPASETSPSSPFGRAGNTAGGGGQLWMLRLRELVESCPHVRCDGMHFASDYPSYGCHATMAVWYPFLSNFLQASGFVDPSSRRWRGRVTRACPAGYNASVTVFQSCLAEVLDEESPEERSVKVGPIGGRR